VLTGLGDRLDFQRHVIDHPDPGHREFSVLYGYAAGLLEQLLLAANAHDGGIHLAQHVADAGQPLDLLLARDGFERE
jgi:hypothetical protein